MLRMSLDLPLPEHPRGRPPANAPPAGGALTDRPRPFRHKAKFTRFADDTAVERTQNSGKRAGTLAAVQQPHAPGDRRVELPPWFRASQRPGGGQLSSEQSLNRIVRRETVSREGTGQREKEQASWSAWADWQKSLLDGGREPANFTVYHSRWAAQRQSGLLPKISPTALHTPRTRTNSSQLFRSHDPVDEWTFGVSDTRVRPTSDARKRAHFDSGIETTSLQQLDKLGLPVVIPHKPQRPKSRPGTSSRPASTYRPNTMARIARRVEMQRKQDMPEPAPLIPRDDEQIDANDVLERLVAVAASGREDLIESQIPDVLDSCAELCQKGQYADAERLYHTVLQYSPRNATALCNLGIIVERVQDNPKMAASLYEQALEASGGEDSTCLINLARVTYRVTSNIAQPRKLLQRVLAIDPTHSAALSNMALLLLSEWVRSNKQLERLAHVDPSLPNAEALILERTGSGKLMRSGSGVWGNSFLERSSSSSALNSEKDAKKTKPMLGKGWSFRENKAEGKQTKTALQRKRFAFITQGSSAAIGDVQSHPTSHMPSSPQAAEIDNPKSESTEISTAAPQKHPKSQMQSDPQAALKRSHSMGSPANDDIVAEAVNAATEAVKLAENFFWQAHDSAEQQGDRVSMALALGNIATIHKMVFQDVDQARDIYKRAIKCDPRHPILRRNYARLYHDLFDEKVEALTALVRGKACKDSVAKGKIGRTAAQLGGVAETEYRAALELCSSAMSKRAKSLQEHLLQVDICLNLAGLLRQDAMGNRWAEATVYYKMAHDFDDSSLEAALGCASIMWERENRLNEAQTIMRTAICTRIQTGVNKKNWGKMRKVMGGGGVLSKFLAAKADRINVETKDFTASLMHASNYMNLAHFEAKTWEIKASSVYQNSERFGAGSVFDPDPQKEWATSAPERNVGEWVYVKYSVPYIVSMVKVKQREVFAQMVRKLGIYFDNGESREMLLLPEPEEQEMQFNPPILSSVVRFEIMQVYGEAVTGLNTIQVFGQHRSAADLTLKYDAAVDTRIASKLQKLKEQTASMGTMEARKQEDQLMAECKVMHARMLLASDDTGSRNEGVDIIIAYLADIAAQRLRFPQLCSSALSAYGAYVLTLETSVPQHYLWFPFVFFDPPRLQGERLLEMALQISPENADAQIRLAMSQTERLVKCLVEDREFWMTQAELNYQTALVKDPSNVLSLYRYALFLDRHMGDLNQAIELYRRAARSFCAHKQLQGSVLCGLATALQRRGRQRTDSQVFSLQENENVDVTNNALNIDNAGLSHMNDLDEAAVWYERCLAINSRNVACLCNYGSLQLHRNYPNKALRHFARAVHIEPYNAKVVAAYAAVLDDVGMDLAIVERMYIRALQLEPTYVLALHGLGTVMHRMERFAEAEMYYKLALGIEPTHEGAFENLEILREATYAQQGVTERSMLRSRDRSRLSSRGGRMMSPRSGLQSRGSTRSRVSTDGALLLQDDNGSHDLSNIVLGNTYLQPSTPSSRKSRRVTPNRVSSQAMLANEFGPLRFEQQDTIALDSPLEVDDEWSP